MKVFMLTVSLGGILAAVMFVVLSNWDASAMSTHGWIALILGTLLSLALGGGLMALGFGSAGTSGLGGGQRLRLKLKVHECLEQLGLCFSNVGGVKHGEEFACPDGLSEACVDAVHESGDGRRDARGALRIQFDRAGGLDHLRHIAGPYRCDVEAKALCVFCRSHGKACCLAKDARQGWPPHRGRLRFRYGWRLGA